MHTIASKSIRSEIHGLVKLALLHRGKNHYPRVHRVILHSSKPYAIVVRVVCRLDPNRKNKQIEIVLRLPLNYPTCPPEISCATGAEVGF